MAAPDLPLPLAASTGTAGVLADLFVVLLAAKLGEELFKRIHQPALVGEILAGVLVGPAVLGLVALSEPFEVFAEIGVVLLLFWVGIETRLSDMREVGPMAAKVGALGVALPLAGGVALGALRGEDSAQSIFLGVALVATSVGITSAVLLELGVMGTRAARTILGAAVIDDVLALLLLAVATGLAEGGGIELGPLAASLAMAVVFIAFFAVGGTRLLARWPRLLTVPRFADSPLLPSIILCLGLAALAAAVGLAAIVGAFLAGMIVAETKEHDPVEDEVAPLYAFFPPFFFAYVGAQLSLAALADGGTLALLAILTALALATKYLGAWLGARGLEPDERRVVGLGMVPRGEVGIIVAGIGQATGAIDDAAFAAIVAMSVISTLVVPPLLRPATRRLRADQRTA